MAESVDRQKETIRDRIVEIVREVLSLESDEPSITGETRFVDDLGAESLDMAQLVMALEEEFEIDIPDEEAEKIVNVKDAVDYIKSHAEG